MSQTLVYKIVRIRNFRLLYLAINIAYYIQQTQLLTGMAIKESEKELHTTGLLTDKSRFDIILRGAMLLARELEQEIYREVKKRENKSYDCESNEMNLLSLSVILACWSAWVFKAKSEDPNRASESREQAAAVSKYMESFFRNAINAGQQMGKGGEIPEGKIHNIEIYRLENSVS